MPVPNRLVSVYPALCQGQAHGHTTDAVGASALGTLRGQGRAGRTALPARRLRDRLARSPLHSRGGEDPDPRHAERALLAATRGAPPHRPVPRSRGCRELRGRAPVRRRLRALDPDRPAHARRRVSLRRHIPAHLGAPGRLGAGDGRAHRRARRLSARAGTEMAPGGAGLLPSGREPQRRGASVRLHGDLCVGLRGGGAGEAPAAAQGAGAVCRGEEPRRARQAALAGAAGGRVLRLGEGSGGFRRRLPAHGLDGGAGLAVAAQCGGSGGERAVGESAELVAPAAPAPGVGDDRGRGAVEARRRRDAGLRREGRARRCHPVARRAGRPARRRRRPGAAQGPVGRGGPRPAAPGHRALEYARTASRRRRDLLRRGNASARRRVGGSPA